MTVCFACRSARASSASALTTVCSACFRARARSASAWLSAIWICTRELVNCVCIDAWAWASFSVRSVGLADQHIDALDVEIAELAAQLLTRLALDGVALVEELQHRLLVGH